MLVSAARWRSTGQGCESPASRKVTDKCEETHSHNGHQSPENKAADWEASEVYVRHYHVLSLTSEIYTALVTTPGIVALFQNRWSHSPPPTIFRRDLWQIPLLAKHHVWARSQRIL